MSVLYSFLTWTMIASSNSSPPMRIDCATTMPPSEMTATSVVPPPMSTTMLPGRLLDGEARADRGRHRLLDEVRVAGAGLHGRLEHGALLDLGDARGHADDHARLRLPREAVHPGLVDEVAQHRLGDLEVGDDAVLERPDGDDVARRAAEHALGLAADGQDPLRVLLDGHDGGLDEHDPAAADRDERVGGTEVHGHVVAPGVEEHIDERHVCAPFADARRRGVSRMEGRRSIHSIRERPAHASIRPVTARMKAAQGRFGPDPADCGARRRGPPTCLTAGRVPAGSPTLPRRR